MRGLAGKRVLVTGGSSGIGAATVRRLLEEGCHIHLGGLDADEVRRTVAENTLAGPITGSAGDVSREEDVARLVEAALAVLGGIDVLINNAGTAWREPFLDITPDHWDRIIAVNLRGMFLVAQAVSRQMAAQGAGGAIINMASTNALGGEGDYAHYNASKAGVLLLTKTMAVELGRMGIRVNAVCPGYIDTPLNAGIVAAMGADPAGDSGAAGQFEAAYAREQIPLGRSGRAEEVAAAYAFLASDDASFIHGAELVVDGGQTAVM